ncbi:uncharacterized protein LOC122793767 [Protopterus annectens]|uniref:uncharacterized protein LOC122793767 n=1 Tax=Protopterus annectens TaxID=7888 RepID=UPI001CFAC62D|nr:uncharacterized protein LOC122793767 [Protopterus annectens]
MEDSTKKEEHLEDETALPTKKDDTMEQSDDQAQVLETYSTRYIQTVDDIVTQEHLTENNQNGNPKLKNFSSNAPSKPRTRKNAKAIFISSASNSAFLERKFISETVRQLKENNLAEDIWYDKDEVDISSPLGHSERLDAVEKCKAAVVFLSHSYFKCPFAVLESKILFERSKSSKRPAKVFPVLYSPVEIPKGLTALFHGIIDLTGSQVAKTSLAEKSSIVIGNLSNEIDKYSLIRAPFCPRTSPMTELTGEFRTKRLHSWKTEDVQDWLIHLGISEFYRLSFAEFAVDGYLLLSVTDEALSQYLGNI